MRVFLHWHTIQPTALQHIFSQFPTSGISITLIPNRPISIRFKNPENPTDPSRYRPYPDISDQFELARAPIPTLSKSVWSQSRGGTVPMPSLCVGDHRP